MVVLWSLSAVFMISLLLSYGKDLNCTQKPEKNLPDILSRQSKTKTYNGTEDPFCEVIEMLLSEDPLVSEAAADFLSSLPLKSIEKRLFPYLNSTCPPRISGVIAKILLEQGSDEAFIPLANYFSHQKKGIAGFLDKNGYNKVVPLFQ